MKKPCYYLSAKGTCRPSSDCVDSWETCSLGKLNHAHKKADQALTAKAREIREELMARGHIPKSEYHFHGQKSSITRLIKRILQKQEG